jgi:KDO2-lipid IV(A) lauroyltransferase
MEAIMTDVNREFERAVRRDPANWFWVHDRWKKRGIRNARAAPSADPTTELESPSV